MQRADLLLTTAQIGMALAGFAGLVTLLSRPSPRADARLNEIRFRNMVELSLMLAAFGLLPFVPAEFDLAESLSWRISSAAYALAGGAFLLHSVRRNRSFESGVYFGGLFIHFLGATFFFIRLLYGAFPEGPPPP